jgi:L-lactate dehydrogenase complex protein LldG
MGAKRSAQAGGAVMDAKADIFSRLRTALQVSGDDKARKATVAARLKSAPNGVIPARAQLPSKAQVELFVAMAGKFAATVVRVKSAKDVPAAVSDYLRSKNLPSRAAIGSDPRLAAMPWKAQKHLDLKSGPSDGTDETGISHAFAAIAESGTLVMTSGADNPTTLNFLPENHIVIVEETSVTGDLESVMAQIRSTFGKGQMPRTVNLITGPSRSGDIEQKILLGAHGPRALHIILVK